MRHVWEQGMTTSGDVAAYTDQLVRDCALDSASILLFDQASDKKRLSYLHHNGISDEAQHIYATRGVFLSDPFARSGRATNEFIRWGAPRIDPLLAEAPDYCGFLAQHDINVVGAWCRGLTADLSVIIGTHRRTRPGQAESLSDGLLQHRLQILSNMVVDHLFEEMLANSAGQIALRLALPPLPGTCAADVHLSDREGEIAALICEGKQNKQVAGELGISEITAKIHRGVVMRKMGARTLADLVRMAEALKPKGT